MMKASSVNRRKVVVVGAGAVGATFAYSLAQSGLADEIAIIDKNESLARGQVMDLVNGKSRDRQASLKRQLLPRHSKSRFRMPDQLFILFS